MTADYFDQIAAGEIDPPPQRPDRYGIRIDEKDSLAVLRVGKSETDLTSDECYRLAMELLRIVDELDGPTKE